MSLTDELASEQAHFDVAWEARERKRQVLQQTASAAAGPTKTMSAVRRAGEEQAAALGGPDEAVAFGKFDRGGESFYVGKHLISSDDHDPLVVSWQAPAAEAYYKATIQDPLGVTRKRTFETHHNTIESFSDTVYEHLAATLEELDGGQQWGIDDALLSELESRRTGEMQDIVRTIHASQYDLIQSPMNQTLLVQGGPGTGKTAIALHRISWLLFNHRDSVSPEECLVIGPNPTFTRYINAVLPGLGDRNVVYRNLRNLGPVSSRARTESSLTQRLKGEARMAQLLAHGLRQRIGLLDRTERLTIGPDSLGPSFSREEIESEILKHSAHTYNVGRSRFRQFLQNQAQARSRPNTSVSPAAVDNALERVWPQLTPAAFLRDLLGSRDRLLAAAEYITPELTVSEVRSLVRTPAERLSNEQWSDADIALLDELDELINGRQSTYAHIVVDEAQDLSPMQLRSIRRRSRSGSMTVVGDIAQSTGPWSRDNWSDIEEALTMSEPCHTHELSLGYRVPRQVFELAASLLPIAAPEVTPPRVVREGPADPEFIHTEPHLVAQEAVRTASRYAGSGHFVGLICPDSHREAIIEKFTDQDISWANVREGELGKSINLASPEEAKGLEFDAVVVVQPAEIAASTERGHRLLYVSLTRTTKYLAVVHDSIAMPLDGFPGSGPLLQTVQEPPLTQAEVLRSDVTSTGVISPDHPLYPESVTEEVSPGGLMTPDEVHAAGTPTPRQRPGTPRWPLDRLTKLAASEVATEIRASLVPEKYADFIEALSKELGVEISRGTGEGH